MDMEKSDQKLKANGKEKQRQQDCSDGHVSRDRGQPQPQPQKQRRVESGLIRQADQEVIKLAATAMSLNVRLRSSYSNMPHHMQDRALRRTRSLIDDSSPAAAAAAPLSRKSRPNPTHLARALKKEFDSLYGPAWHCVVGKSFGSFVTHSPGGFLYFSIDDSLSVLLFKTEVQLVKEQQPAT